MIGSSVINDPVQQQWPILHQSKHGISLTRHGCAKLANTPGLTFFSQISHQARLGFD
jgi:hypothetical protein